MIELRFFSTEKTKQVKKKLLSLLYTNKIDNYRRSQIQKQYKVINKKVVSSLGYVYYLTMDIDKKDDCLKILKKEFGEDMIIFN